MGWSSQDDYDEGTDELDITLMPSRRALIPILFTSLLTAAVVTALLHSFLGEALPVPVPAVVGAAMPEAKKAVTARGLGFLVADTMADPLVAKGAVSLQDPVAGELRAPGHVVLVTLSAGKPVRRLPDRATRR